MLLLIEKDLFVLIVVAKVTQKTNVLSFMDSQQVMNPTTSIAPKHNAYATTSPDSAKAFQNSTHASISYTRAISETNCSS